MYSAYNDVTYFRRLGEFDKGRSLSLQKSLNVSSKRVKKQYFIENSSKTSKTHTLSMLKDADNEVTLFDV